MARQTYRFVGFILVVAAFFALPQAFISAPTMQGQGAWMPAVGAGAAVGSAALPAWAYSPDLLDAQMLLSYVCGGKYCKERNMVVVAPEEDGVTDKQIADGVNPVRKERKGNITPLVKRIIENGY